MLDLYNVIMCTGYNISYVTMIENNRKNKNNYYKSLRKNYKEKFMMQNIPMENFIKEYSNIAKPENKHIRYLRIKYNQLCCIKKNISTQYLKSKDWKKYPVQKREYIYKNDN